MPLITILKKITESLGYRMINSSVRWGVEMIDDLPKAVGQPADFKMVFDVGANRGQTLKRFLTDFPKAQIYSFEARLISRTSENSFHIQRKGSGV